MRTTSPWYLIKTRPKQEQRACENLENQGFRCFLPWFINERLDRGKRRQRQEPLFPGYLFIELSNTEQNWGTIRSTRGVQQLVAFGGKPTPVPQQVVNFLQQQASVNNGPQKRLQPGEKLRITRGPFAQLEVVFQAFDGNDRVIVLLELMQKQHRVKIQLNHCHPLAT